MQREEHPSRRGDADPERAVWLRPVGSPAPLGFAGLAVASLVVAGLDFGWIEVSGQAHVGLLLIAFAFPAQQVASVLAFLARDGAVAGAFGVQAVTWLAIGVVYIVSAAGATSSALGLLLLASGTMLGLGAVAVATTKLVPALVVGLCGARFAVAGVYELSADRVWQDVSGAVGLAVFAAATYSVLAFALEDETGRTVLPVLRRGRGKTALEGSPAERSAGATAEPGVRQVL